MNPLHLVPLAEPVPAEWGWLKLFLILGFTVHILMVNIVIGGGMISLFAGFDRKNSNFPVYSDLNQKLTAVFALAVNFGVLPFLFLQVLYGQFVYISSQLMAVYWLSAVLMTIIAYYSLYYSRFSEDTPASAGNAAKGITVLLLLSIAFIFSNNMSLMLKPETWAAFFTSPDGTLLNLSDPMLFPRYLHFVIASVAVGGLFVAIIQTRKAEKGDSCNEDAIALGMKCFTIATLFQIPAGFWFQMSLPREIMYLFLGKSPLHTAFFVLSLILIIQSLYFGLKKAVWAAAYSLLVLVFAMTNMRDMVRTAFLDPFFSLQSLEITGQYSPMLFFALSLFITAGLILYVLELARKASQSEPERSAV
ncbi:MAG: hypothetical protein AB7S75_02865 [Desulfococcaceae bacterium]